MKRGVGREDGKREEEVGRKEGRGVEVVDGNFFFSLGALDLNWFVLFGCCWSLSSLRVIT